ncbi:hypothetical protein [Paenibacillus alginolyticus]|uniref:Uncharacterized protein n=1 Tax=Paenibacillus alginolyticus TaxID=59839 RepID=A0ABT4GN33_9BACL|nr:hypothetical protein [Paenibacillus alginolyticus]MCY9697633.1 hypothetical protein [Paenibacillus alginolyticus]MEC0148344.1 hypothetical protein [Paenibacillus alginolyticus]
MTTITKPVIPSLIAESIESLRSEGWVDDDFFNFSQYDEECPKARILFHYFRNNRATFAAAIVNSYVVHERIMETRAAE